MNLKLDQGSSRLIRILNSSHWSHGRSFILAIYYNFLCFVALNKEQISRRKKNQPATLVDIHLLSDYKFIQNASNGVKTFGVSLQLGSLTFLNYCERKVSKHGVTTSFTSKIISNGCVEQFFQMLIVLLINRYSDASWRSSNLLLIEGSQFFSHTQRKQALILGRIRTHLEHAYSPRLPVNILFPKIFCLFKATKHRKLQ